MKRKTKHNHTKKTKSFRPHYCHAMVRAEQEGYAPDLVGKHQTVVTSTDIRDMLVRRPMLEVIS